MKINLNKELAWITFLDDDFENKWFPVTDITGKQLECRNMDEDETIMFHCRKNIIPTSRKWGIANTSQMLLKNAMRDNF